MNTLIHLPGYNNTVHSYSKYEKEKELQIQQATVMRTAISRYALL